MVSTAVNTPYSHELKWPPHLRPFDPWDPEIQTDPWAHYTWMLEHAPVLRTQTAAGDAWYLSRYRDVQWVFRTPKLFSSQRLDPKMVPHLIVMDDPDHTRLRAVVAHAFSPKAVANIEDQVRGLAEGYFQPLVDAHGGEVIASVAIPLTMGTIASLLGLPLPDTEQFRIWLDDFGNYIGRVSGMAPGSPTDESGTMAFVAHMRKALDNAPVEGDSLLSCIARARREGNITEDETKYFGPMLFNAGYETTTHLIGNGIVLLAEMPHLLARLHEHPGDVPKFVEELLRFKSSIHRMRRSTTQDVEISGHKIPAGTNVFVLIAAANRDAEKFPNPDVFDMDRITGGHVGFGFGMHFCLGAWLARMEARVVFELVARTVSKIELYPDARRAIVPYVGGTGSATGAKSLTVRLTLAS